LFRNRIYASCAVPTPSPLFTGFCSGLCQIFTEVRYVLQRQISCTTNGRYFAPEVGNLKFLKSAVSGYKARYTELL